MRKSAFQEPGCEAECRKSKASRRVRWVIVFLALVPLGYECASLTNARWQSALGHSQHVETPILDYLGDLSGQIRSQFGELGTGAFRSLDWEPSRVVPLACAFAALGAWFLRRGL